MTRVVDASVVVAALVDGGPAGRRAETALCIPDATDATDSTMGPWLPRPACQFETCRSSGDRVKIGRHGR
jgi:hypothetical protein